MAAVWAAGPLPMMQSRVFRVWRSSIAAAEVENFGDDVIAAEAAAEEEPMVATPIKLRAL